MKIIKSALSPVFDRLMAERGEDVTRVINARRSEEQRRNKANGLMRWYMNNTGSEGNAPELTDDQTEALKKEWKDLYDLGIIRPEWYRMYAYKTGQFNPDFIPSDLHYYYVEYNKIDFDYLRGFLDKNYMDVVLPGVKHPPVLVRKIHGLYLDKDFKKIDADTAVDIIYSSRAVGAVIKISIASSGGKGVSFVDENSTKENIREELSKSNDLHIEQVIQQHPDMEKMNASSINTIRIITMMIDGECVPLSACVRIGNSGSRVDNFSSGGVGCGVRPDGTLNPFGFTQKGDRLEVHPNGFQFSEGKIPNYDKVIETVKRLHYCVSIFGVANWDICIDPDGEPVLIEYNVGGGGIDLHQYNNGPLYGEYRERIISQVFSSYKVNDATLDYNFSTMNHEVTIGTGSFYVDMLTIPKELKGNPVRYIGAEAFKEHIKLKSVVISADLDEVGYCAFYKCEGLKKVAFRGSVKTIGRSAFNSCRSLTEIVIPEGTETISIMAFRDCSALKTITLPKSLREIAPDAFEKCSSLTVIADRGSYAAAYAEEHHIALRFK